MLLDISILQNPGKDCKKIKIKIIKKISTDTDMVSNEKLNTKG